jgi:hypothetical protein
MPLTRCDAAATDATRLARAVLPARARHAGDTLRINFNFSFPHLACQYASVDVSDVLGMARARASRPPSRAHGNPDATLRRWRCCLRARARR